MPTDDGFEACGTYDIDALVGLLRGPWGEYSWKTLKRSLAVEINYIQHAATKQATEAERGRCARVKDAGAAVVASISNHRSWCREDRDCPVCVAVGKWKLAIRGGGE